MLRDRFHATSAEDLKFANPRKSSLRALHVLNWQLFGVFHILAHRALQSMCHPRHGASVSVGHLLHTLRAQG